VANHLIFFTTWIILPKLLTQQKLFYEVFKYIFLTYIDKIIFLDINKVT